MRTPLQAVTMPPIPNTSTTPISPAATQPSTHVAPTGDTATAAADSTALSAAGTIAALSASGLNTGASVERFIPAGDGLIGFVTPAGAFIAADGTHAYILTNSSAYFFTLYDVTNSRWVVPAVADGTSTNLNSGDTVSLIGSVNMSAADYANISVNHFSVDAA